MNTEPMTKTKKTVLSAVFAAICVVLPQAFHVIPNAGSVFLPMHIPVLLCGLVCGWSSGLLCGLVGPLLSSLITGMPPLAVLPAMMVECAAYGAVTGLMLRWVRTGSTYADLYVSMVSAMLAGRVLSGMAKALIFAPGTSFAAWAAASFVTAMPGIVIQLALIPTVVFALMKAGVIPQRYLKATAQREEIV